MPSLRFGLVGCGYQGRCLATAAARTTSVSFVACADPDAAAAERVAGLTPNSITDDRSLDSAGAARYHLLRGMSLADVPFPIPNAKPGGLNLRLATRQAEGLLRLSGPWCRPSATNLIS